MMNVMVIEDRILTLNALKTQIPWKEKGLNPVGFYTNCKDAMEHIEDTDPDVIISDIVMPGMDGLSFCKYINSLERNIKIIIISAYSKFEYAQKGIQLGVFDFLEKPVDYGELCERILQAGKLREREEKLRKIHAEPAANDYTAMTLDDYAQFDHFEKKLKQNLECADFEGIRAICGKMKNYIEKHNINRSYLVFFVTNFLSVRIKLGDLSELNRMTCVADIMRYLEDILLSICSEKRKNAVNDTDNVVGEMKQYLEEQYKKVALSLGGMAQVFNMSPNYVSRIFKEKTGYTVTAYISNLRILEAKRLLSQTNKKIWEISQELGYSSQYHFSMGFKKATGYSPKDYRKIKRDEE